MFSRSSTRCGPSSLYFPIIKFYIIIIQTQSIRDWKKKGCDPAIADVAEETDLFFLFDKNQTLVRRFLFKRSVDQDHTQFLQIDLIRTNNTAGDKKNNRHRLDALFLVRVK